MNFELIFGMYNRLLLNYEYFFIDSLKLDSATSVTKKLLKLLSSLFLSVKFES